MLLKPKIYVFSLLIILISSSCDFLNLNVEEQEKAKIIPDKVYIDIPSCLNSDELSSNFKSSSGDSVYNYLRYYLFLKIDAERILQQTYNRLKNIDTKGLAEFSFTGVDGNTKLVSLRQNYVLGEDTMQYYMQIYNESYSDLALEAYWNLDPLKQVITYYPSKVDVNQMQAHPDCIVKIDFNVPGSNSEFDTVSNVFLYHFTLSQKNRFMPDNMLITIGKKSNSLTLNGSINVPEAWYFDANYTGGRNWTFFSNCDIINNRACVQLALPNSWYDTNENLFNEFYPKVVFANEVRISRPDLANLNDDEILMAMGINPDDLETPGYFNENGYFSAGESVPPGYENLLDFNNLVPIVPVVVRDSSLTLGTKKAGMSGLIVK
ncbi:MAG: hypothetical protein U0W24_17275 [Bacteroidales bacterium]